jgi:hypothetical protein
MGISAHNEKQCRNGWGESIWKWFLSFEGKVVDQVVAGGGPIAGGFIFF